METKVEYFPTANWATLQGSFTPEELRQIAKKITKNFKKFKGKMNGNKE